MPIYQQATRYLDAGDLISAETLYRQLLEAAPAFSTAYRRLGSIASYTRDLQSALVLFRQALETHPNSYNQPALGIGALIDQGLISPETTAGEIDPAYWGYVDPGATIHQLLTHTAGIYD